MFDVLKTIVLWYLGSIKMFFSLMPRTSSIVIYLSLISRIAGLLSFLLPIKVVLMLGSSRTPRFFPDALKAMDRDSLIIAMSVAALVFYLLNLAANKGVDYYVGKCTQFLSSKNRKLVIFREQKAMAEAAFGGCMGSLSGMAFLLLSIIILEILYPNLLIALAAYLGFVVLVMGLLYRFSPAVQRMVGEPRARRTVFKSITTAGFFTAFAFIVVDFLLPIHPPSLMPAIIGIILTRQALANITGSVTKMIDQYKQRGKVEALLFQGRSGSVEPNKKEQAFWDMAKPDQRQQWIGEALKQTVDVQDTSFQSRWCQTGISHMAAWIVEPATTVGKDSCFFVKLYNQRASNKAVNDVDLVSGCRGLSLMLPFRGAAQVRAHHCHVFDWSDARKIPAQQYGDKRAEMFEILLGYEVPKKLVEQYRRSHLLLWQRLNVGMLDRLQDITSPSQQKGLDIATARFDEIIKILRMLPLQLNFSKVSSNSLACVGDTLKLVAWSRWYLEPIGFHWAGRKENYATALEAAAQKRRCLESVSVDAFGLSVTMSNFERSYQKQDFDAALECLNQAVACLEEISS